jgi:hypothetical protein
MKTPIVQPALYYTQTHTRARVHIMMCSDICEHLELFNDEWDYCGVRARVCLRDGGAMGAVGRSARISIALFPFIMAKHTTR